MFEIHSYAATVLFSLATMLVEFLNALPADDSLTAPVDEYYTSSSTLIDPEIVNVLDLCAFSPASLSAALQAQHSVSLNSSSSVSGVELTV
jgi:hypothetical protein